MNSIKKVLLSSIFFSFLTPLYAEYTMDELFDLSLEELLKVQVHPAGSFTKTDTRRTPASITLITQEQIITSGARNLMEVMEIYVPNFQYLKHYWEPNHIGMRGVINDRDGKFLLLVNGRVLNEKTHFGALSERDLPMMGDIAKIEVVRGPGSAIYGPGAVGGVISITTDSAKSFEGTAVQVRGGFEEAYQMAELKHGLKINDNSGFYLYAGAANYDGSNTSDSPVILGHSNITTDGQVIEAGEPSPYSAPRDRSTSRGIPFLKLHTSYFYENFDIWARYTQGGEQLAWSPRILTTTPEGFGTLGDKEDDLQTNSVEYKQFSTQAHVKHTVNDQFNLDYYISFDTLDYTRTLFNNTGSSTPENHREDEYQAKLIAQYTPNDFHSLAFGVEYSYEEWGMPTRSYPNDKANITVFSGDTPEWNTNIYSIMGEYQWKISDKWTSFLGIRMDKHSYTDEMYSPRAALIYTPTEMDTIKLMLSKSTRMNFAEELKRQWDISGKTTDPEEISTIELAYEHLFNKHLQTKLTGFYNELEVITFSNDISQKVGDESFWGAEFELFYKDEGWDIIFSHAYTKLIDFDLVTPTTSQGITAQPYGYGNDFTNWSNHISKLIIKYEWNEKFNTSTSLRTFWGYPGAKSSSDLANDTLANTGPSDYLPLESLAVTDEGYNDPSGPSIFLNIGAEYELIEKGFVRADAHNVLGWFDSKLNKRLYYINVNTYREEAPAFSLSFRYEF